MLFTDLIECKSYLEIDQGDKSEDRNLNFFIEHVSQWFEELLNRPGMDKKERTEYYNGSGTQKILLRSRPVFTTPTPRVFLDESGNFGATSGSFDATNTELTYGEHFALILDQENGTSRSGILYRIRNFWPKPTMRMAGLLSPFSGTGFGVVKIIYTAGYTPDSLPASLRMAANLLVARLRYIMPLGVELNSEGYEERSIGIVTSEKDKLLTLVNPILNNYKNRKYW